MNPINNFYVTSSVTPRAINAMQELALECGLDKDHVQGHLDWWLDSVQDRGQVFCPVASYMQSLVQEMLEILGGFRCLNIAFAEENFSICTAHKLCYRMSDDVYDILDMVMRSQKLKNFCQKEGEEAEQGRKILSMIYHRAE